MKRPEASGWAGLTRIFQVSGARAEEMRSSGGSTGMSQRCVRG